MLMHFTSTHEMRDAASWGLSLAWGMVERLCGKKLFLASIASCAVVGFAGKRLRLACHFMTS